MYNSLADWIHNIRKYITLEWDEVIGFIVTALFGSFILTFNDWGDEVFDPAAGVRSLLVMFFFLFFVYLVTVMICKVIALRFGFKLTFQPHLIGLMLGLVVAVASAGYLPIFLTGGFTFMKPWRLYVGHWRGYNRTYETAMIAGMFPMLLVLYMLILNPLYLATESSVILGFIGALGLTAIYSLIPLPNIALEYGGRVTDFFRYLKGMTFGLEVFFNSRTWYVVLAFFVLTSSILSYVLTRLGGKVSIFMYVCLLILGLCALYVYKTFIEQLAPSFRS